MKQNRNPKTPDASKYAGCGKTSTFHIFGHAKAGSSELIRKNRINRLCRKWNMKTYFWRHRCKQLLVSSREPTHASSSKECSLIYRIQWCFDVLCILTAWFQAIYYSVFNTKHWFGNSLTAGTITCKCTSPQLVAVSGCACERSNALVHQCLHRNILISHSSVLEILLYVWIQSKEAINLECYWRVINGQSGESFLFRLALA